MNATARLIARIAVPLVLLGSLAAAPTSAVGAPPQPASCMGIEMEAINPPGTSDEEPGGASQFVGEIKEFAEFFGWPFGLADAYIAQLHSGSHEDCDAALGG